MSHPKVRALCSLYTEIILKNPFLPGAIIGDGDRKRALFLVLGLPHDMGQIFYF